MTWLLFLAIIGTYSFSCQACRCDSKVSERTKPSVQAVSTPIKQETGKGLRVDIKDSVSLYGETLLKRGESAYGTSLFVLSAEVLLLTQTAAIRLINGEPAKTCALPFGSGPAVVDDSIVYFHEGAVRVVTHEKCESKMYSKLERPPMGFFASNESWGWLGRDTAGAFALFTFHGNAVQPLYKTTHAITFTVGWSDSVFFIEKVAPDIWRIGRVPLVGGTVVFSSTRKSRIPSMLAPTDEGIYIYDGPSRMVRRLNLDLQHDRVLADRVICSPLAVSDRVICAHLGGVYEIPAEGGLPRPIATEVEGPITALAADDRRVVWVVDTAEGQLTVRSRELTPR